MFGKGKSKMTASSKFVMAAGRAVGNITPPKGSGDLKGRGTSPKSAPTKDKSSMDIPKMFTESGRSKPGKAGPVKIV
jgi:hypothetical protein